MFFDIVIFQDFLLCLYQVKALSVTRYFDKFSIILQKIIL